MFLLSQNWLKKGENQQRGQKGRCGQDGLLLLEKNRTVKLGLHLVLFILVIATSDMQIHS